MRKLFLLGTMLGVAGTALAFGGVFNHGSKSSTYKGGVDAIGVHFGGEKKTADSQASEISCNDGTVCGEGCCYNDNICKQTSSGEYQCCNEELDWCCDVNEKVHVAYGGVPGCCAGEVYCPSVSSDGVCETSYLGCCTGEIYVSWLAPWGSTQYGCCPGARAIIDGSIVCCSEADETPFCTSRDSTGNCMNRSCFGKDKILSCLEKDDNDECLIGGGCPKNTIHYLRHWGDGYESSCCAGTLYCSLVDPDGECVYEYPKRECCEDGEVYILGRFSYGDLYNCCHNKVFRGVGVDGADVCCWGDENYIPYCERYDSDGNCTRTSCCNSAEKEVMCAEYDGDTCIANSCCEPGQTAYLRYDGPQCK